MRVNASAREAEMLKLLQGAQKMPNVPCLLLTFAIQMLTVSFASASGFDLSFSGTLDRVSPAIVGISTTANRVLTNEMLDDKNVRRILGLPEGALIVESNATTTGSGVIIDGDNGYIVTSRHVIADADDVAVTLKDGRVFPAEIVGSDATTDLGVIKIGASPLVALDWGRSSDLKVGDFVAAVGSPLGLEQTATFGIVSGLGRSGLGVDDYEDYIQTDAAVNPGSSGGALVNAAGELLGVMRGVPIPNEASQGIAFAIPSDIAAQVVQALIKDGEIKRGWLGVSVTLARTDDGNAGGLVVDQLACNSAAERQGVRLGDIITALNGRPLSTEASFNNLVSRLSPDARITLDVRRGEAIERLALTLSNPDSIQTAPMHPVLGTVVFGLPVSSPSRACMPSGPVLLLVPSDGAAFMAGLRTGDYLTAINGEPAFSAGQIQDLLEQSDGRISIDILRAGTAYRIEAE